MNLVIDSGNTALKAAIFEKDQLKELLHNISLEGLKAIAEKYPFKKAVISSVNESASVISEKINMMNILIIDKHTSLPFKNLYKTPETLGTDRIAAVAGAKTFYPQAPCLAIDAGTCITFDFIDADNNYHGGSISPGINLRFKALHNFTARLPLVNRKERTELIGGNTEESMQSGVMKGIIAEVDGMIDSYRSRYPELQVIICGGDTPFFETNLKQSIFVVPDLVLIGLNRILEYNAAEF
ncbi:MAG TPA: type III pantothenate kinase [Cytophagaceae bacterium]|jgi:type III pantothenate kinase|nr:type III pantothenate kinase [Cytophagaceae bacterium]